MTCAQSLGMGDLVEVHEEKELQVAVSVGADLIGINNRDLRSFEVDLATTEHLAPLLTAGATLVAVSGIFTPADIRRLIACGVCSVLIGEGLVMVCDPGSKILELFV